MKSKNIIKTLLTFFTLVFIIFAPILLGSEIINGKQVDMLYVWVDGVIKMFKIALIGVIGIFILAVIFWMSCKIYKAWSDIIDWLW
jgi:hypothetical protein